MTKLFEIKNLIAIRLGIDRHNANCPIPAEAILMNPVDCQLMAHPRLWGVPVIADPSIPIKRFQLQCEGSPENIEEELEIYLGEL
jgi:hypothetical protein